MKLIAYLALIFSDVGAEPTDDCFSTSVCEAGDSKYNDDTNGNSQFEFCFDNDSKYHVCDPLNPNHSGTDGFYNLGRCDVNECCDSTAIIDDYI